MGKKTDTNKPLKKTLTPVSKKIKKEAKIESSPSTLPKKKSPKKTTATKEAASKKVTRKTAKKVEAKGNRQKSVKAKPGSVPEKPKKAAKKVSRMQAAKRKAVAESPLTKKAGPAGTTKKREAVRARKKAALKKTSIDLVKTAGRQDTYMERIPQKIGKAGEPLTKEDPTRERVSEPSELRRGKTVQGVGRKHVVRGEPQKSEEEAGLPEEYGENDLLLMVVDPLTVYASWEITKDSLPHGGDLFARILDVTGVISEAGPFDRFLEVGIDRRVGSGFFEIRMPGREVIMEIGFFEEGGTFKAILRSDRVSLPPLLTFDELGIVKKLFEGEIPVGY